MRTVLQHELTDPEQGQRRQREQEHGASGLVRFPTPFFLLRNRCLLVMVVRGDSTRQSTRFVQSSINQPFAAGVDRFIDHGAVVDDAVGEVTD
ncbi:hypothetical protein [Stieleria sedimenti]|uniref:hypothetical protein n=1 Tax=Stieleria sedimenti TaxID=2976331 RepID=UPI00389A5DE1